MCPHYLYSLTMHFYCMLFLLVYFILEWCSSFREEFICFCQMASGTSKSKLESQYAVTFILVWRYCRDTSIENGKIPSATSWYLLTLFFSPLAQVYENHSSALELLNRPLSVQQTHLDKCFQYWIYFSDVQPSFRSWLHNSALIS